MGRSKEIAAVVKKPIAGGVANASALLSKVPKADVGTAFKKLVPRSGPAPTIQGELVRSCTRLAHWRFHDANMNWASDKIDKSVADVVGQAGKALDTRGLEPATAFVILEPNFDQMDRVRRAIPWKLRAFNASEGDIRVDWDYFCLGKHAKYQVDERSNLASTFRRVLRNPKVRRALEAAITIDIRPALSFDELNSANAFKEDSAVAFLRTHLCGDGMNPFDEPLRAEISRALDFLCITIVPGAGDESMSDKAKKLLGIRRAKLKRGLAEWEEEDYAISLVTSAVAAWLRANPKMLAHKSKNNF